MAKGDTFLIKTTWNGEDFYIPGICNTELIDKSLPSDSYNLDLGEAFSYFDSYLGTTVWQLGVMPVYQVDDYAWAGLRRVLPGIKRVLVTPSDDAVTGPDGAVIPNTILTYETDSRTGGSSNSIRMQNAEYPSPNTASMIFPYLYGVGVYGINPNNGYRYSSVGTSFIIAKDDFLTNGKIQGSMMGVGELGFFTLFITYYPDPDYYECYFGRYMPGATSTTAYWDGKEPIFPSEISTDPFEPGGETPQTPGGTGGTGDFDGSSTDIGIPDAPSISAASTRFISLFNPSLSQLNDLASFMWSDLFDIDTFKKLFADPMQTILGLSVIPGPIPSAGASEVKVGNISTGVTMNKAAQQYITIDCGSLNVNEYWGAYLDYDPYTKCEIYLPYIGTHAIAADDIMGKTVRVVYRVDILSGACIAYIKCGGSVLYQFAGQCAASIPITGNDWTNVINGAVSVAASIGSLVATGGASAPLAANSIANAAVNQMKPSVEKSGSLSGAAGIMGIQQPYLIITRPRQALPYKQNTYSGYPSLYSVNLSELTGYTEIEKIHLEGIPATEKELVEIDTLLKGGVIF